MGQFDDFDVALAERDAQLYSFRLGGHEYVVPPGDIKNLAAFRDMGEALQRQGLAEQIDTLIEFVVAQLAEDDRQRFVDTVVRVRPPLKVLAKIAERIAEQVTGRPLDRRQPSLEVPLVTGPIWRDDSSAEGTLPPPSPPSPSGSGSTSRTS